MSESTAIDIRQLAPPKDGELLVVVGPTASGKTELALRLCEELGGEVLGADSVQIYQHFNMGSGKPTAAERARATHHLIDCVDPMEPIDAAAYGRRADDVIDDVRSRGRLPIVCGGSFLWIKALLFGLAGGAPADPELRQHHREIAEREGRASLHRQLQRIDPDAAQRLAPNDLVRVSRALEVHALTGKTQTAWHREHQFETVRYPSRLIAVEQSREQLDQRIHARCALWLEQGWIQEVEQLLEQGFGDTRAMASVGYRQVHAHLRGEQARDQLATEIVRATRRFARRQRTWLRDQNIVWIKAPS